MLARWLSAKCDIILFDEPTRGLDIGSREEIHKVIRNIVENGKCALVSSSDPSEIVSISDRIILMRDRTIAREMDFNQITEENLLKDIYN